MEENNTNQVLIFLSGEDLRETMLMVTKTSFIVIIVTVIVQ